MKVDAYKTAGNNSGRLVESILSHMLAYKNTSIKKHDRIESARSAKTLIEYIISAYVITNDYVLINGLQKINLRLTECIMNPDVLLNLDDEIGFMRILKDIVV